MENSLFLIEVCLCFSGCLVVSWSRHLAVLASLAVGHCLRNHLALPDFPS